MIIVMLGINTIIVLDNLRDKVGQLSGFWGQNPIRLRCDVLKLLLLLTFIVIFEMIALRSRRNIKLT